VAANDREREGSPSWRQARRRNRAGNRKLAYSATGGLAVHSVNGRRQWRPQRMAGLVGDFLSVYASLSLSSVQTLLTFSTGDRSRRPRHTLVAGWWLPSSPHPCACLAASARAPALMNIIAQPYCSGRS